MEPLLIFGLLASFILSLVGAWYHNPTLIAVAILIAIIYWKVLED